MSGALAYKEEYEAYEFINGREYMMARPSIDHIQIGGNIYAQFKNYLRGKCCRTFSEPDVYIDDADHVIPDVIIVCNPDIITKQRIEGVPDLVVEILSRSTARRDRMEKLRLYERCGVREYWIVDPRGKSVEVYLLVDGHFNLDGVYQFFTAEEYESLTEREKAEADSIQQIKVSLYDDFIVKVKDVFEDVD